MKIGFTGDIHCGHFNVLRLCNRPFPSLYEMEKTIRDSHNSMFCDEDVIYNLGDVGYKCSPMYVADFLKSLNGKIVIILGNHDKPLRQAIKMGMLKKEIDCGKIEIVGGSVSVEDPTLAVSKMIVVGANRLFLSHYALRSWPSAFRGTIHLFGHSHSNLKMFYKSMDVGVDTNNFRPYLLEDILSIMDCVKSDFKEDGN